MCMRYDPTYEAMIASGTWRAKSYKPMAEEASGASIRICRADKSNPVAHERLLVPNLRASGDDGDIRTAARARGTAAHQ